MQKTRLGISAGLLGAAVFLVALLGGYIPIILLAGYILLFEENKWLKKSAVKAAVIVFAFGLLSALIGFIPDIISVISNIFGIFGKSISIPVIPSLISFINSVLYIVEKLLLIAMALKAFTQGSVSVGFIDEIVNKNTES
jgi:uncharacterized membrane protein